MSVLATSAAERPGLKAGDEILSHGGTRVFDTRELTSLSMQVSVPRGPLGVTAPGGGRPGGLPGGGPGGGGPGFRGGR